MHCIMWYGKGRPAKSVWIPDLDTASDIAQALQALKFKVIWFIHLCDKSHVRSGYEKAYERWVKEMTS